MNNVTRPQVNTVLARLQERLTTGLSLGAMALEMNISKSALSQFLNAKYTGDNEKLAQKAEQWLASSESRQKMRAALPPVPSFLMLPSAEDWISVFEYAQSAQDIGIITGAPGTGKTAAAEYYRDHNPNIFLLTADSSCRAPASVLRELAELVDIPERSTRLMRGLIRRLRNTNGLIIIDEAQHLTTEALDLLRALNDQAEIGIVWTGNEPLRGRIEGLGRQKSHAQIYSRVGMWKNRQKPRVADIMPILDAWNIQDKTLRQTLRGIGLREGGLREINKTLRFAYVIAGADGRDAVTLADIEASWAQRKGGNLPKGGAA